MTFHCYNGLYLLNMVDLLKLYNLQLFLRFFLWFYHTFLSSFIYFIFLVLFWSLFTKLHICPDKQASRKTFFLFSMKTYVVGTH